MDFQQALRRRIRHFTFHVYKKTGHEDRPEQPLRYGWSDPRTTANGRQPHERRAQDLSTISPPHQLLMRSDAGTNHSWNNNHSNNIWEYSWRRRTEGYVAFLSFFFQQLFRQFALSSPLFKPIYWLSARWPSSPLPRPDFSQLACRV